MQKYKGYYIDNVIFSSKEEIDNFIVKQTVERYKKLCMMFNENHSMELIKMMMPVEEKLHALGFDWDDIEAIELSTY